MFVHVSSTPVRYKGNNSCWMSYNNNWMVCLSVCLCTGFYYMCVVRTTETTKLRQQYETLWNECASVKDDLLGSKVCLSLCVVCSILYSHV